MSKKGSSKFGKIKIGSEARTCLKSMKDDSQAEFFCRKFGQWFQHFREVGDKTTIIVVKAKQLFYFLWIL